MVNIIGSWVNQTGYVMLRLSNHTIKPLHVLIWENLHGKKMQKYNSVNHIDFDITRNCASNLKSVLRNKNHRR